MMRFRPASGLFSVIAVSLLAVAAFAQTDKPLGAQGSAKTYPKLTLDPREKHFSSIRQLTFGGENAEAYFSFDGKKLIFQSTRDGKACDQIYSMGADGSNQKLLSTGTGRTTCAYYLKDGKHVIYSSTHLGGKDCPPRPDFSKGYVWALYPTYDIFVADADGKNPKQLTTTPGYDAEATVSPDGKHVIFTSDRSGDIELYIMDIDGKNVRQVTNTPGYDGGAFFSHDGKKIVWRASRPEGKDLESYQNLLKEHLIRPSTLDIYVMDLDGSHVQRLTNNGKANFAPFFTPDDKKIIFSSNMDDPKGRNFDLYLVNLDGMGLERVTFNDTFDGFPMFSPDGKKLVFCSNRNGIAAGETNAFMVDWKP
jgi:TolB protein